MPGSSDQEISSKRRQDVSNKERYKRNVVRESRVQGRGYVSYSGKDVAEKTKPNTLLCKCPAKCSLNISEAVIDANWSYFYSLVNKNSQDTFIQTLVELGGVKRRRNADQEVKMKDVLQEGQEEQTSFKRNHTFLYNIKVDGALKRVCKGVFMGVYGISRKRIERICQLLLQNKTPKDKRGLSRSGNAISGTVCVEIHNHIFQFEVKETHYGNREIKYLDARLSIRQMYEMFVNDETHLKDCKIQLLLYIFQRKLWVLFWTSPG